MLQLLPENQGPGLSGAVMFQEIQSIAFAAANTWIAEETESHKITKEKHHGIIIQLNMGQSW